MKPTLTLLTASIAAIFLTSCLSNTAMELGGAAKWVATGAKIDAEPKPMAPDPAIIEFKKSMAPLELKMFSKEAQAQPSSPSTSHGALSPSSRHNRDLLERGQTRRIRRLVR